jgi:MFS family permease
MLMYTVFSVLCGISTNFGMFFGFRLLQAACVCVAQAIGGGTISDICKPQERGKVMSYYIFR